MRRALTALGASLLIGCSSDSTSGPPPSIDGLNVPAGFSVSYFARDLDQVRMMALGPDGAVYVTRVGSNSVFRVWDQDGDGVADSVATAVSGLNAPHGLAFRNGLLYIANTNGVVRVQLGANGRAIGQPEQLNSYASGGGHWTRSILFGADGAMYVSIGSSCNVCVEQSPERAAVMRYDANGQNGRVFASGLRNALGMAVYPPTGAIWVSQHERDNIPPDHENLPPEEINILVDGGDYGWPYCHSDRVPNPEFNDAARCASTIPPALQMQAHSAPMGMVFLAQATKFPADWRGDALLAFHGSWNRSEPTGAKIVRVRVQSGLPVSYEDFITGWQRPNGTRWGRPVDVIVYSDGSVLISDDHNDAIYRVTR